jgi:hypothetical protein
MSLANQYFDRPELARLMCAYGNKLSQYIATQVLGWSPNVNVENGSFRYADTGTYFNRANTVVGDDGRPNYFSWSDDVATYNLQRFAAGFQYTDTELSRADTLGFLNTNDMIRRSSERTGRIMVNDYEARFTSFMTTSGNYSLTGAYTALPTSVQWNGATADPIADFKYICEQLYMYPNIMIIGEKMYHALQQNAKVLAAGSVTASKRSALYPAVTTEYLSNVFEIENVVVSHVRYNSTPNEASATVGFMWDSDNVFVGYLNPGSASSPIEQSFARNLVLNEGSSKRPDGWAMRELYDPETRVHKWFADFYQGFKVLNSYYGYLATNMMA